MRRLVIVVLALSAVLVASSPASAARARAYRGETSAGTKIGFLIRVADDGRMSMKGLTYRAELLCEDSSTIEYWSQYGFGGVGYRLDGRRLTFDDTFYYEALHVAGVFRAQVADGTFENIWSSLTETEEAQLCTSGELTWTAERVPRDRVAALGPSRSAYVEHRIPGGTKGLTPVG